MWCNGFELKFKYIVARKSWRILSSLKDEAARKRYYKKLSLIEGLDPYEMGKDWVDNVDLWPSVTHINVESYRNFLAG